MKRAIRALIICEMILATHLGAFGRWWAASAAHRLGKFSGERAEGLK